MASTQTLTRSEVRKVQALMGRDHSELTAEAAAALASGARDARILAKAAEVTRPFGRDPFAGFPSDEAAF